MLENWLSSLPGAAAQGIIWGIMAIGVYITYKILDFADLTVDGSICTGGAVCAVLVGAGVDIWLAMLIAMLAGMLTGFVTGILHTVLGIPPILSGILTQLMLWSINMKIMGGAMFALSARNSQVLISSMQSTLWQTIATLVGFVAVIIAILYWFFGTERGASIRATGNNPAMSRAQGINIEVNKILALVISNGMVALAGALLAQYNGQANINAGRGAIVTGLAAVIIGDVLVSKLSQNFAVRLTGVVLGGIVYFFVYQTIIFLGLDAELLKMFSAIVVAIFLAIPYLKEKYFHKAKKRRKKDA